MKLQTTLTVLLMTSLAGCLGNGDGGNGELNANLDGSTFLNIASIPLSEPRFGSMPAESMWIEASTDGQMLHAVVWRPDVLTGASPDPDWKAPVILVDTPYRTSNSREDPTNPHEMDGFEEHDWLIDDLVPRGYAVAFKDVRGTGESGGCIEQTGYTQRQDGYDVIEFFGTQTWSNGKVGMYGISYLAETQYSAALLAPPHLTTIVPVASVSGQYEWNFYDGVPFTLQNAQGQALYLATSGTPPGTTEQGVQNYPSHFDCWAEMTQAGTDMSGDWTEFWEERELRTHFDDIEASVLYVHGLQDWNVRQVAIRDSFEHITSEKRLILGQWHHNYPSSNSFNQDWSRADWFSTVHAWYDYWLLDMENGILESLPPVQIQDSQGAWRAEASYPPADTSDFVLHLSPESLSQATPAKWSQDMRENEEAFIRSQGLDFTPDAETPQATELVFTSEPLTEDVRVSGWPTLEFDMMLFDGFYPDPDTEIDAHFASNLAIVDCADAHWINAGYLSASHRDGLESPTLVQENEVVTYNLRFHPEDTVIPAGCRLELRFAGSDDLTQPEGTFWGGTMSRGVLRFPAIDRDLAFSGLDVPFVE